MVLVAERFLGALLLSSGITFGLFWMMTLLIEVEAGVIPVERHTVVEIVNVMTETPLEVIRRRPPVPKAIEKEPTKALIDLREVRPGSIGIPILTEGPMSEEFGRARTPKFLRRDMEASALVRVPPAYPEMARRRGIEGRVLIEFTIGKNGSVDDARVIAAEPGNVFNSAALDAVRQWRYEPKIVDGEPVEQRDQRIAIPFRLDDASDGR